jgi:DNA-binding transcriptional MerR regulator
MGMPEFTIPDKLVFRIGEVSRIVGVEPYVLRYWESEFRELAPKKSSSGQRVFRKKDVELLLRVRHLLYDRKFTIEGARNALAGNSGGNEALPEIRKQVVEILKLVSEPPSAEERQPDFSGE